jgi:hypothetical protein
MADNRNIFSRLFFRNVPKQTEVIHQELKKEVTNANAFDITTDYGVPYNSVFRTSKGYLFGVDGFFPQQLNLLYSNSPLHSAIINFKKLLASGNGFSVEGIEDADMKTKININQLTLQFEEMLSDITLDLIIHNTIAIEIYWNQDFTKIVKLERISPDKIRIDNVNEKMEPTSFLYNWDWVNSTRYPTKEIKAFSPFNKKEKCQLMYFQIKSPGMQLYAEPSYESALPWVILDAEMAQYHKANIINSLNPSMLIQYFEKPGSAEEKQQVLFDINNSFAGARRTGRAMITFSDGKELAPTVTQMEPNKLDKTFLQLTDTIQRQICYAHGIDPQLLGLKTPGSLGNSGELIYAYEIFNASQIQPLQKEIEKVFNKFMVTNGLSNKIILEEPTLTFITQPK